MPRPTRSEPDVLLGEARAIEIYAENISVPPDKMPEYWDTSLDLVALVADIEEMSGRINPPDESDPELLALRRRLRGISARLSELDVE